MAHLRNALISLTLSFRNGFAKIIDRKLSHARFLKIKERYKGDPVGRARYFATHYHCRTIIDPELIRVVKRLRKVFNLINFVETGTYDGDTSLFFSLIFDKVFTCDVIDHKRRPEFYLMDNLLYETKTSPEFLKDHLKEIGRKSFFYFDAHWQHYWPLSDELAICFKMCQEPVVMIDDFDAGGGLDCDTYDGIRLDFEYIAPFVPDDYNFFVNSSSNRNRGVIFLFPGYVGYGCSFRERKKYNHEKHSLWGKES